MSCYKVNEYKYLFINFNNSKISGDFLKTYIDSVKNRNTIISDSIKEVFQGDNKLPENERIIYFKKSPEEWYRIVFDIEPCWIRSIYNKHLSDTLIHDRDLLGKKEIHRIEVRFQREILKPAEMYGRSHRLPDSVIYQKKLNKY